MRTRRALTVALVTVFVSAGCIAAVTTDVADPLAGLPSVPGAPVVQDHDHSGPALHTFGFGATRVGHAVPYADVEAMNGGINELLVRDGKLFVSRTGPDGGFAILDVSDPATPAFLGAWSSEPGNDIELSASGDYAFVFTQRSQPPPEAFAATPFERVPRGVYVVDVSDPTAPAFESFYSLAPNGPHTGTTFVYDDGREIVVAMTYDLTPPPANAATPAANPATQRVTIFEFTEEAGTRVLEPLAHYQVLPSVVAGEDYFPHDAFVQKHPVTGQILMYVAYWDAGLRIVDIADPTASVEVAAVTTFAPSAFKALHYTESFPVLIDGRHITVVGPELITAPESGQLTLFDTTDPAAPVQLGHFSLPGSLVIEEPLIFSPHNFDLDPFGRIHFASYHGGYWAIDVGTAERLLAPVAVAFHQADTTLRPSYSGRLNAWGANWGDGVVYVSDSLSGVHVLRLDADAGGLPARPAVTAFPSG